MTYVYEVDGPEPYITEDVQGEALEGTLDELARTIEDMIERYGPKATFEFEGGCRECGGHVEGRVRRPAAAEEIATQKARNARIDEVSRTQRQQLFEKLKTEFEPEGEAK